MKFVKNIYTLALALALAHSHSHTNTHTHTHTPILMYTLTHSVSCSHFSTLLPSGHGGGVAELGHD